jgi:hypothetical protein
MVSRSERNQYTAAVVIRRPLVIVSMRRHVPALLLCMALVPGLPGCTGQTRHLYQAAPEARYTQPVLPKLFQEVRGMIEQQVGAQQVAVLSSLADELAASSSCRLPLVTQTLTDPWAGLAELEKIGYRASLMTAPGALPRLIAVLEKGMSRTPPADAADMKPPSMTKGEQHLATLRNVLSEAHRLREVALRRLTPNERQFLFEHASLFVQQFVPHLGELTEHSDAQAQADQRFCQLVEERLDYGDLIAAAQVLAQMADGSWLEAMARAFSGVPALDGPIEGVTGTVLLVEETPFGRIIVGGKGPNTYTLSAGTALIIDLGGDDAYAGLIAASDFEHGLSVAIDLAGNDVYQATPMGLATGRLGVGLLVDRAGDDVYHLSQGTGGAGFAGLGILYDRSGDDQYHGSLFTQGAAVAGLGLLLDGAGHDRHTSSAYAVGFGGPGGVGAVIDVAGNDDYQCGDTIVSDYTAREEPESKPGDARFQYDCFGIGAGSGKRIFVREVNKRPYGLGGGLGLLLDLNGNDRYRSGNFSQGAGYFFGVGLKLDLAGNDDHAAARFGHAAGAHAGVGLFIDAEGDDRYRSTGPTYNGGAAWDRSVMLAVDAGPGNDRYDLRSSTGLGRAEHHAWSVFIEEGGQDRYDLSSGMGMALEQSMSGFFDLSGEDDYSRAPSEPEKRENGRLLVDGAGGLFVDR